MIIPLAEVDQTKHALRIDDGDLISDADIERLILVASESVISYLKSPAFLDENPLVIPPRVTQATIMLVGYLYRSPDADPDRDWEMGFLPKPVMALLYPLREPTIA